MSCKQVRLCWKPAIVSWHDISELLTHIACVYAELNSKRVLSLSAGNYTQPLLEFKQVSLKIRGAGLLRFEINK